MNWDKVLKGGIALMLVVCYILTFKMFGALDELEQGLEDMEVTIQEISDQQADLRIQIELRIQEQEQAKKEPIPENPQWVVSSDEIKVLAQVAYGESSVVKSKAQRAAVIWCILNRVDAGYGTIIEVATAPNAFAWDPEAPLYVEYVELAKDVTDRWIREKSGEENVGRTLPVTYRYFIGDGKENHFTEVWKGTDYWDWSLPNPYSS